MKSGFSVSQVRLGSHSTLLLKWGSQKELILLKNQCCGLGFCGDHAFLSGFYRFPCLRIRIQLGSAQNRQSAKIFLQSSELGPPHPLSRRRVCPPPFGPGGEGTLGCGRGVGGVPILTRGHTLWCSLYISTLWVRALGYRFYCVSALDQLKFSFSAKN